MAALPPLAVSTAGAAAAATKLDADLRKLNSIFNKRPASPVNGVDAGGSGGGGVDTAAYAPLLQQCIEARSPESLAAVHGRAVKEAVDRTVYVGTYLVDAYMKCSSPASARRVLDGLEFKNVVAWTALIAGYVRNGMPEAAASAFAELLAAGRFPTHYTLGAALSACAALRCRALGEQIHAYMVKYQVTSMVSMGNSLCSLYAKSGDFTAAVALFEGMPERNVITWTTLISACSEFGDPATGLALFAGMVEEGVPPNEFTLTSAVSLCCVKNEYLAVGRQLHGFAVKADMATNLPVKNSLMYMYLKAAETEAAARLVDGMDGVNIITWNATIAGNAEVMSGTRDDGVALAAGERALAAFVEMTRTGMSPDAFSFSSVLAVCARMVAAEQGEQVHAMAMKAGCLADPVVSSALVNMYSKCGAVDRAAKAFGETPAAARSVVSWTVMVNGYAQHGHAEEALRLFDEMTAAGVRPNGVTFVGVLSACSYAGLVEEAERHFAAMKAEYGISPVMDHYACIVDMYVRLGRLEEAFAAVETMEIPPNEVVWSILIAGCRSHGNAELGFRAAERLLAGKPRFPETYAQLLSMYIAAERWDDVAGVRRMMRDMSVTAVRDQSSVTVRDKVHCFSADDMSHPESDGVLHALGGLIKKAKALGYVPHESAAADGNAHHSERLAVAFGLMNAAGRGAVVRVVKNMAMCRDCHSLVKTLSVVAGHPIIVRDSRRMHRFDGGRCSCGDFAALI